MELVCIWCGETRAQHRDSGPIAKMPCGGMKSGFSSGLTQQETRKEAQADLDKHIDRWWGTYNAALTGLCAGRSESKDPRHHEIHLDARVMADIAHGALK